jgi:hypothetical protein
MKRTQIYLDDEIAKYLALKSKIEKKSISEIIRESLKEKIVHCSSDIIAKLNGIAGLWRDRKIDPRQYVRERRMDRAV